MGNAEYIYDNRYKIVDDPIHDSCVTILDMDTGLHSSQYWSVWYLEDWEPVHEFCRTKLKTNTQWRNLKDRL